MIEQAVASGGAAGARRGASCARSRSRRRSGRSGRGWTAAAIGRLSDAEVADDPSRRARRARADRPGGRDPVLHRADDRRRRASRATTAGCAFRARWSRTSIARCRAPLRAARPADPAHDLEPWGSKVYFGTAGRRRAHRRPETASYRELTLADLYDIARLVDRLDHIHFFQRPWCPATCPTRASSTSTPPMPASPGTTQACRHQLRPARARRRGGRDAASGRRRRGRVAGAAVRHPCPAASSCRR